MLCFCSVNWLSRTIKLNCQLSKLIRSYSIGSISYIRKWLAPRPSSNHTIQFCYVTSSSVQLSLWHFQIRLHFGVPYNSRWRLNPRLDEYSCFTWVIPFGAGDESDCTRDAMGWPSPWGMSRSKRDRPRPGPEPVRIMLFSIFACSLQQGRCTILSHSWLISCNNTKTS